MADRWGDLSAILDEKLTWGTADARRAIRLLGKDPGTEEDDAELRTLHLAISVSNSKLPQHLGEFSEEKLGRPVPSLADAKVILQDFCGQAADRLLARAIELESAITPEVAEAEGKRHGFDATDEGKELRRSQSTLRREMMKSLETLMKLQKHPLPEPKIDAPEPPTPPTDSDPKPSTNGSADSDPQAPTNGSTADAPSTTSSTPPSGPARSEPGATGDRRRRPPARRLLERARSMARAVPNGPIDGSSDLTEAGARAATTHGGRQPHRLDIKTHPPSRRGDTGGVFGAGPLPHPPPSAPLVKGDG